MHIDFHYYATYSMARAAGLNPSYCQIIASAAQYVDDNKEDEKSLKFMDGGRLNLIPTSHPLRHLYNTNILDNDQRTVWLPFHFLPGNEGNSLSEKIVCRKNSLIAQEMMAFCQSMVDKPFGLFLLGIASHVYADTFSHYGFSGVSSRWNKVKSSSIELENENKDDSVHRFSKKYEITMGSLTNWRAGLNVLQSEAAELFTGALGHGAVLKYPDYPYLKWGFEYENSELKETGNKRDNVSTYLEACENLHRIFREVGENRKETKTDECLDFEVIQEMVKGILEVEEPDMLKRADVWCEAVEKGKLFSKSEKILPYLGDEWNRDIKDLENENFSSKLNDKPVFKFFQAAATYRTYVLRDLLPQHGLILD